MSTTGLEVFDKTLQTTHIWLDEIMAELGPDRQRAYHTRRTCERSASASRISTPNCPTR